MPHIEPSVQFDPEEEDLTVEEKLRKQLKDNAKKRLAKLLKKKEFTKYGKLRLLDAGGALEKEGYKAEQSYFFTGTLPGEVSRQR